jgi:hypothetical protein
MTFSSYLGMTYPAAHLQIALSTIPSGPMYSATLYVSDFIDDNILARMKHTLGLLMFANTACILPDAQKLYPRV